MNRWLAVAVLASGLSSCTFGVATCDTDADCTAGGQCLYGFCTVRDSGMVVDAGNDEPDGGDAGLDAGGSDAGGPDGGERTFCDAGLGCAPYEECAPSTTGGRCMDQDLVLSWSSPSNGAELSAGRVTASVTALRRDGGSPSLVSVPVDGGVAPFLLVGSGYAGELLLSGADGPKVFVAGWPAPGPSASLTLIRDTTPPEVLVQVEPRPASGDPDPVTAGAWKKDELAIVRVAVDGGRTPLASDLHPRWGGAVTVAACQASCPGACGCFALDLAGTRIDGLRGTDSFVVGPIQDNAGNASSPADAGVQVSRLKWSRSKALGSSASPLLPVAVTRQGVVLWGGFDAPSSAARVLATGQDGGLRWGITASEVTAGPVVGADGVWLGTVDGLNSQLQRFDLVDGGSLDSRCIATAATFGAFRGDLALGLTDGGVERPFGLRSGAVQFPTQLSCNVQSLTAFPSSATARSTLVTRATGSADHEVFAASTGASRLWKVGIQGDTPQSLGDATLPSSTQPRGLFFDGASRAGGGGGGVVGGGTVFTTLAAGSLTGATFTSAPAANSGPIAVGEGFMLFGTSDGTLQKLTYDPTTGAMLDGGSTTVLSAAGPVSLQDRTPVLGAAGLAYVVGDDGFLSVRRVSDLAEVWSGPLVTGAAAASQPALDVYRRSGDARDCATPLGVLYVLTQSGATATLTAVLVDSRGLAPNAPWPRFQRDNANTGSASSSLAPWTCP